MGSVGVGWKSASGAFGGGGGWVLLSQRCCEWDRAGSWEGLRKSRRRRQPLRPVVAASLHPPERPSRWSAPKSERSWSLQLALQWCFSSCSSSEQNQMVKQSVKCNQLSPHRVKPGIPIQGGGLRGFPFHLLRRGNGHPLVKRFLVNVGIPALSPSRSYWLLAA